MLALKRTKYTHLSPPSSKPLHKEQHASGHAALQCNSPDMSARVQIMRTEKAMRAPVLTEQVFHLALSRVQRQVAAEYDAAHSSGSGPLPLPARRTLGPCYLCCV